MIEHLPLALTSLKSALSIGKTLVEINDATKSQDQLIEFNNAIIDAQSQIISAQSERTTLVANIQELENEINRLKAWDAEREKYVRKELASGIFAYIENNYEGDLMSAHKYCCNCFDNYNKSTLQQFYVREGRKLGLSCHNGCPDLVFRNYIE